MSYEGWANYETWAVKLWLDNEQDPYNEMTDAARRLDVYELSAYVKDRVEDAAPDLGASVYSDLLRGALSDVDWREIAEAYIAERDE